MSTVGLVGSSVDDTPAIVSLVTASPALVSADVNRSSCRWPASVLDVVVPQEMLHQLFTQIYHRFCKLEKLWSRGGHSNTAAGGDTLPLNATARAFWARHSSHICSLHINSCGQSASSRRQTFDAGLCRSLYRQRSSSDRTRPSAPGKTRVTRARGQRPRGTLFSVSSTRSPICRLLRSCCHFPRCVRHGTCSLRHLLQNWPLMH